MIKGFAAVKVKASLTPFTYEPKSLQDDEVEIKITHCGICHSDIHLIDNDWGISTYPLLPGHEIVGEVAEIGASVRHLKKGQRVGVGWQCGSCQHCEWCQKGEDNLCLQQEATCVGHHGGFADRIRVGSRFAFPLPTALPSAAAAPLFCGGATVFSPFQTYGLHAGSRVGVIGIGGLGHMALQFAKAFGCETTAFSTHHDKEEEAKKWGASHFVATKDEKELEKLVNHFDCLLCTVSAPLNWPLYLSLLRPKGVLCLLGAQQEVKIPFSSLINGRKAVAASNIAGPVAIQEMLRLAAEHQILPQIEVFPLEEVNTALEKVRQNTIRYRAVLEIK